MAASCRPSGPRSGRTLPGVVERAGVVDRAGWVHANVARSLRSSVASKASCSTRSSRPAAASGRHGCAREPVRHDPPDRLHARLHGHSASSANTTSRCFRRSEPGRLLFVEENIRQTAAGLGLPLDPFRPWIALHETTHAFEFEAHPWLRPYLAERLERQLTLFSRDARDLSREAIRRLGEALRGEARGEHWLERLMTDEQRRALPRDPGRDEPARRLQRLRDGRGRPGPRARRRADLGPLPRSARERSRSSGRSSRLDGHGSEAEQYKRGERFVRAIADGAGRARCARLWEGPRRCRPTPRSSTRSAGSRASLRPTLRAPSGRRRRDDRGRDAPPRDRAAARAFRRRSHSVRSYRRATGRADLERIRAAAPGARLVMVSRRRARRRSDRRRRGAAPRLAARRCLRSTPRPRSAPGLGPLRLRRRGARAHARGARARPRRSRTPAACSASRSPSTWSS